MITDEELAIVDQEIKKDLAEIKRLRGGILSLEFELASADGPVPYTYIRKRLLEIATNNSEDD